MRNVYKDPRGLQDLELKKKKKEKEINGENC